jgi:hypothetical protein
MGSLTDQYIDEPTLASERDRLVDELFRLTSG